MASISPNGEVIYSDVNIALGGRSNYELVLNENAVQQSIINIITTRKGSRPFRRDFGSNLMDLVFDPLDEVTARRMRNQLLNEIAAQEPRVVIEDVEVVPDYDNDQYYVNISGWMPQLENARIDFNFNMRRNIS